MPCIAAITPSCPKRGISAALMCWACSMRQRRSFLSGCALKVSSKILSVSRLARSPMACTQSWKPCWMASSAGLADRRLLRRRCHRATGTARSRSAARCRGRGGSAARATPATSIRDGEVGTPRGSVRATEVVVAINAAATGWRPVARHVTNFGSYVVLTEPVPELLEEIGWTGGEAVLDARMFLHYFRTTNDGRVLMGSGSGPIGFRGRIDDRFTGDAPTAARAEQGLRRLLPGLAEARIERAWGGPIDVSADHLPFFGTVSGKRVHYGLGYSGHGVGPTWLGGQILASLVLHLDDEWTALPLASRHVPSLPPEPLKHLGGALVRSAILACEHADEENRRAPLPARLGAALPRLFGMEIGTR